MRKKIKSQSPLVILVLGATGGIGFETVKALLLDGHIVISQYRTNCVKLKRLEKKYKNISLLKNQLVDGQACVAVVREAQKIYGRLDIVIDAIGGISGSKLIQDLDWKDWHDTLRTEISFPFYIAQAAFPFLKKSKQAQLIFFSSTTSRYFGSPRTLHYAVAKSGLECFVRGLARDWGPYGIRVNAVRPTFTLTSLHKKIDRSKDFIKERIKKIPLRRAGTPEEIADFVSFLCSPKAKFFSGGILDITGGE